MNADVDILANPADLAAALAQHVTAAGAAAVTARGRFMLAIPGGSVLTLLAQGLHEMSIDAARWHVCWTDERAVPADDRHSNFREAGERFLPLLHLPPSQLHPIQGSLGPDAAARHYQEELQQLFEPGPGEWPRFDLILLGVGEDGHVASLFPGDPALLEIQRWAVGVRHAPKPPPERITLTLPVLNQARQVIIAAAGEGKADIVAQIFATRDSPPSLPIHHLHPRAGDLHWLLDRDAAAALPTTPTAKEFR
ncbi:MAG: 6-phosphogluconolactonase [Kiritimatiellia bacterium]|jgi:6-phosphogluconolactonase|nr:6-phosphogluconolactonase [Kiritimatiellia bacterium]